MDPDSNFQDLGTSMGVIQANLCGKGHDFSSGWLAELPRRAGLLCWTLKSDLRPKSDLEHPQKRPEAIVSP